MWKIIHGNIENLHNYLLVVVNTETQQILIFEKVEPNNLAFLWYCAIIMQVSLDFGLLIGQYGQFDSIALDLYRHVAFFSYFY